MDLLFKNALLADGSRKDILTGNGKIIEISKGLTHKTTVDCEPYLLLTGMVDVHVHFRDPGFPQKETAETGTKAALRGGVTSIIDMPNTYPTCTTLETLSEKKYIYAQKAYCNYGFHFGADAQDNSVIVSQAESFCSLKIFLNESTGRMLVTDDSLLNKFFASTKFISVHAEGEAVDKAIYFAKKHDNILYLCHISLEEEIIAIKKAKSQKLNVYAELTPHHVLFNETQQTKFLTMKPLLRSPRDQEKILEALDDGFIDTWGTDHAPHLLSEKESEITYGIEGIEFALENLLTLAKKMNWKADKVQKLYSSMPAEIFRIKNKGLLREGADADFVLVDLEKEYTVTEQDIVSKAGWSPYTGLFMHAKVMHTYIRGAPAYQDGIFKKSPFIKELSYER